MKAIEKTFSFCVLAYNHENYILEHLESIKFLVENYAKEIKVHLVINDDFSVDNTVNLIEGWLSINGNKFDSIVTLYNKVNLGTCKSLLNVLEIVNTDFMKITAGDDVYSYENIFEMTDCPESGIIVSGFPLDLRNNIVGEKKKDIYMIVASYFIYKNKSFLSRFKWPSNNNAPNIMYNLKSLKNSNVINYLSKFDVVEDWPIQIALAENYPAGKFILINKVFTYYRRTQGSTYIVAGSRFSNDQIGIYEDLISKEKNLIKRFLLKNRLFCFRINNKFFKKILNLNLYIYMVLFLFYCFRVKKYYEAIDLKVDSHIAHYKMIYTISKRVKDQINSMGFE